MRNAAVLASFALLFTLHVHAQTAQQGTTSVSIMIADPSFSETSAGGAHYHIGYAAAVNYWWTPRLSSELAVTSERRSVGIASFDSNGQLLMVAKNIDSHPVDLNVQYHFFTSGHWKPYLGGGIRYLSSTSGVNSNLYSVKPEINGGVVFEITPHFGIKIDAKTLLGNSNWPYYDQTFKSAVGVTWRF